MTPEGWPAPRIWLVRAILLLAVPGIPVVLAQAPEQLRPADPLLVEQLAELALAADYLAGFQLPEPRQEAYIWPVEGRISSQYGWRNVSVGGNRNHGGIDIVAATGTPVAASRSGVVTFSGWNGAYGYVVYVDHGDGSETRYAHLSVRLQGVGAWVAQGDVVGLVGSTGASTGPHLHFEIRLSGAAVDPLPILRAAGGG